MNPVTGISRQHGCCPWEIQTLFKIPVLIN
jgi:hypothetical protein